MKRNEMKSKWHTHTQRMGEREEEGAAQRNTAYVHVSKKNPLYPAPKNKYWQNQAAMNRHTNTDSHISTCSHAHTSPQNMRIKVNQMSDKRVKSHILLSGLPLHVCIYELLRAASHSLSLPLFIAYECVFITSHGSKNISRTSNERAYKQIENWHRSNGDQRLTRRNKEKKIIWLIL